jgi:predicted MPP superfamily phosphohydrolase
MTRRNEKRTRKPARRLFSRRRFLKIVGVSAGGLIATGGLAGLYAWLIEPHWIEIVRRDLPIANLPGSLAGRTLAVISDLHVGPIVEPDYLRGAMGRVNLLKPDMLAILGDFMSADGAERVEQVVDVIGLLERPPMGIVAVLGNHDYGHEWRQLATADLLARRLGELGARVLRNETMFADGLHVVGLDDLWAHDPTVVPPGELPGSGNYDMPEERHRFTGPGRFFHPELVLPRLPHDAAGIVLVHNPDAVDHGDWAGYHGWVISGHTHGGQVDLPLVGPPLAPIRNKRYLKGAYDLADGRRLYVSRGLGYLKRVRFCSRPEITLFSLKQG